MDGRNTIFDVPDSRVFFAESGLEYSIRDGILYTKNVPARSLYAGSIPAENYDCPGFSCNDCLYNGSRPIHEEFGGPRLENGYIADLEPYIDVDRILVFMHPETEGVHWKRTDSGILILNDERWDGNGLRKAYEKFSTVIRK